ncbi:MAG: RNA polymerase sigma factor [Planctomycetes bacterium]|nr:RNA polymerase sigma factor [Planctomycetota bacterium]
MPTAVLTKRATKIPNEPASEDAVLLRRFSEQGDTEALDALFRRHSDAAYRVALRSCQNASDAEDAVQTAFLKILRDARQFQGKSSVRGWIMSIVVNACRMKNREEAQRRKREESAAAPGAPREAGLAAETSEAVAAALQTVQTLPDLYRMPVWLHYVEGYGYDEVAAALEVKEKTVREQARRGLEQVRQALAAAGFAAGAAAVPELLSSAALPAAPAALVA